MGTLEGRSVGALACFDSFGKTAMNLLQVARRNGATTCLHLLELPGRKLSRRQVLEIRRIDPRTPIRQHRWNQLRKERGDLAQLDALTLWTPGFFNDMLAEQDLEQFMGAFTPMLSAGGLADRNAQTRAALAHDIRRGIGDFEARAADLIRARALSVTYDSDHMVNPAPSAQLMRWIGGDSVVMTTACGHMGTTTECHQEETAAEVNAFLAGSP